MKQCSMCSFSSESDVLMLQHAVRYHKNDPHFLVKCTSEECGGRTFHNWHTFKTHVQRKHPKRANVEDAPLEHQPVAPGGSAESLAEGSHDIGTKTEPTDVSSDTGGKDVAEDVASDIDDGKTFNFDLDTVSKGSEQLQWDAASFLLHLREVAHLSHSSIQAAVGGVDDLLNSYMSVLKSVLELDHAEYSS